MKKRTRDSIMRAISFMLIMIFVIGDVSSIAAATQTDMNITLNPTAINSPGLMHIEENDFNVVDTPVFYMDYDAFASVSEPLNFGEAISASGSIFDTIELTHDPVSPILDPEPASFGIQGLSSELELEFDARIPNFHTFYNIFDTFETTTPSALNVSMDSTIGVMPRSNVVTIVYRGNGHTGGTVPASHSISTPGSIVLRSPGNMIRAGHIFFGWRDSGGNIFPAGQTLTWTSAVAGTLTLDAYWIPSTVTIHYRGNGHTGGTVPASQTITTPGSISLRLQGNMVRAGHTFLGWHDGGGNIFWPGETITFPNPVSGSIILDAHWGLSTVTINYRGNGHTGGTVPASQSVHTPGSVNLRTQGNLVRTGYVFAGWRDSVGTIFAPGQLISWNTPMTGTLTLDAHWIPSTVTIQYRGNGHTSGTIPANQTVNTPGSVSLRAQGNMARSGHIFVGWRDSAGDVFPPGQVFNFAAGVHGTMTLDAHWIPSIVTINYRSNGHTSGTVPASQNVTTPGSVNVRAQGNLARTGYVFSGWMDAGGNVFAPGQTVDFDTAVSGTVTLNAVWEAQCTETWYTFTVRDGNRDVEVYVLADMSRAVTRQAGSSIGTELRLIGNSWVPRGNLSFAPGGIAPADGSIAPRMAPPMFIPMMTINIDQAKNAAIAVIRGEFLDTFGFTPNMLTAEDMRMITLGISNSIDDNLFFGLAQWITRSNSYNDNYFYLRAKTATTTLFIAHYGAVAGVSAVNAVNALRVAGASGKFALMTAPTGGGVAAGGVVAVGALVTAAGSAAVSVSAVLMMDRSVDLLGRDLSLHNSTRPPAHIDFAEEIIQETRDAIANNPNPSKTASIESRFRLTQTEVLDLADRVMGSGYTSIGPPDRWIFRKRVGDVFHQFRMDPTSLAGNHWPNFTHVHFQILDLAGEVLANNHIIVIP